MAHPSMDRETVARVARFMAGLDLSDEDVDAVLPYVRIYLEHARKLEALGLSEGDPREYIYAEDRRMVE